MIVAAVTFATQHRVALLATLAFVAAAALIALRFVKLDALPDVTTNQVLVLTSAPGFSPDEVERRVTMPVELALAGVPGLIERRSTSRFGISSITAVFEDATPAHIARQLVMERLASVSGTLPETVSEPELGPLTGGLGEIFHITLRSKSRTLRELRELAELRAAPVLRGVAGIVEVNTWGGERRALAVEVEPARLARHRLTLGRLREQLGREIGNAPAGSLPEGTTAQVLLRASAQPNTPQALAALRVETGTGSAVRLSELGQVREIGLPRLGAATQDGRGEVVYLMAQMLRDANALEVTQRIQRVMPAVRRALPPDVQIDLVYDRSQLVRATLNTVGRNLAEGGLLVVCVLFAMLGSFRAGLIVAAVIPLAMLGASVGMALFGVAGNLMSLGALDFGLLVDGAVVMVEHIFHEQLRAPPPENEPRRIFITRCVTHIAKPMSFSVLLILLVYLPVLSLRGVDGKMFRPMALVVVMALATALVLTLTYVPAAAAAFLRPRDVPLHPPLLAR
ncbi:MAG TPA: efflux RND transporter permease subunit, partial [Polyangiales bacterium]|nr:efflux RND transporter permease subunit [Polyangiales bacterium]